jgi:acetoin utilization protein AcuB
MTVEGIMSRDVVTVTPDTTLMEIRKQFQEGGFHHLLVVDDDKLLGVISDRDVLQAISPFLDTHSEEHRDVQTLAQLAEEVMRTDPVTVTPGTKVEDAAHLLLDHKISSLPVVKGDELVGIATTKDLLSHYTSEE